MKRRKAREHILQALYMVENQNADASVGDLFSKHFLSEKNKSIVDENFLHSQLKNTLNNLATIDAFIESASENWKLTRMSRIDRNLLRLAVSELLYCDDISVAITIDEALEIAKKYGSDESAAFINGVLDMVSKKIPNNPKKALH